MSNESGTNGTNSLLSSYNVVDRLWNSIRGIARFELCPRRIGRVVVGQIRAMLTNDVGYIAVRLVWKGTTHNNHLRPVDYVASQGMMGKDGQWQR